MSQFYPVIGIETHVQLNTRTKLFCSCVNEYAPDEPNKNICPFCTGQPGALPALNKEAVRKALTFGVAIGATIPEKTRWDRKNYFYPDLPAGYQISQYDNPIVEGGEISFYTEDKNTGKFEPYSVRLTRAHLEADAGKLLHAGGKTYVDFNRAGCPLVEIVSEPEMHTANQAMGYVGELQLLVRKLGISDADMEKGQMRFDCNISLQNEEEHKAGKLPSYKVEVKNINSIRALGRAIEYEIKRQTEMLKNGEKPQQETRGWRDDQNKSESQRSKEEAMDYRYFPEPDLRILEIKPENIPNLADLPELPGVQRNRYLDMGLGMQVANTLVTQDEVGKVFEQTIREEAAQPLVKTIANIVTGNLIAISERAQKPVSELITIQNLISLAKLFQENQINNQGLAKAIDILIENPELQAEEIVVTHNLVQVNDDSILEEIVNQVIEANQKVVDEYKSGKVQVIGFIIGQCMKESKGQGNPQKFKEILEKKLS